MKGLSDNAIELEDLKSQLDEAGKAIAIKEKDNKKLRTQQNKKKEVFEKNLSDLRLKLETSINKCSKHKKEADSLKINLERLNQDLEASKNEGDKNKQRADSLQLEVDRLTIKNASLSFDKKKLEDQKQKNQSIEQDLSSARMDLTAKAKEIESKSQEVQDARKELERIRQKFKESSQESASEKRRADELDLEVTSITIKNTGLLDEVERLQELHENKLRQVEEEKQALVGAMTEEQKKVAEFQSREKEWQTLAHDKDEIIAQKSSEAAVLQRALEKQRKQTAALNTESDQLKSVFGKMMLTLHSCLNETDSYQPVPEASDLVQFARNMIDLSKNHPELPQLIAQLRQSESSGESIQGESEERSRLENDNAQLQMGRFSPTNSETMETEFGGLGCNENNQWDSSPEDDLGSHSSLNLPVAPALIVDESSEMELSSVSTPVVEQQASISDQPLHPLVHDSEKSIEENVLQGLVTQSGSALPVHSQKDFLVEGMGCWLREPLLLKRRDLASHEDVYGDPSEQEKAIKTRIMPYLIKGKSKIEWSKVAKVLNNNVSVPAWPELKQRAKWNPAMVRYAAFRLKLKKASILLYKDLIELKPESSGFFYAVGDRLLEMDAEKRKGDCTNFWQYNLAPPKCGLFKRTQTFWTIDCINFLVWFLQKEESMPLGNLKKIMTVLNSSSRSVSPAGHRIYPEIPW